MDQDTKAIERAFQLAKSGKCRTVKEVKRRLFSEGYDTSQIEGRTLTKQLNALIKEQHP